jgi:surface antigen
MSRAHTKFIAVPAALALIAAAGCTSIEEQTGVSKEAQTGAAAGAAAGGVLAAVLGASTGWVIASAVLGGIAGGVIADYMTEDDKAMAGQATTETLEEKPSGEATTWQNPDSGNSGTVVANDTFYLEDGTPCRHFTTTVNAGGKSDTGQGTACRASDGTWQIKT